MLTAALAAPALFLLILLYCYFRCFFNPPARPKSQLKLFDGEQYKICKSKMLALMDEFGAIDYEPVEIQSHDGLKLCGRYYHADDSAPLQILCHGYKGSAVRDFCGGSRLARRAGHNILAIDHRAHGKSQGKTISFGIKERLDLLSWIEYANSRFGNGKALILSGVSMGAATVLMASELELPANVKCIIADCPYSSPRAIIGKVCRDMKLPPALVMPFISLAARLIGGFRLDESSAEEAVKKAGIPILIIHGEDDRFVPCDMSHAIAKNSSMIRLETFPGAGHGLSYIVDEERYTAIVDEFLASVL